MTRSRANPAAPRRTGDAAADALLTLYARGLFPMADEPTGAIELFAADPRGVLPLIEDSAEDDQPSLHVSRSLRKAMRNRGFVYRMDEDFAGVMRRCAAPRSVLDGRWISEDLITWYEAAFRVGHAHCLEACLPDPQTGALEPVGGIYGVTIGAAFFGESMYARPRPRLDDGSRHPLDGTDASKAALVTLCRHLRRLGYTLFDTQMVTGHVARFGAFEVSSSAYMTMLREAIQQKDRWAPLST
jgi:leucyl/phenylalanyl-tRNA---protein transferase